MRATTQESFGFDLFEAAGWTCATVEDRQASARRAEERERARRAAEERARRERFEREQRERREEQARRNARARSRQSTESLWDVLGIRPGAGKTEVRAAWVRLCRQHHPDAGGDVETMKRVNRAYNDLKGMAR